MHTYLTCRNTLKFYNGYNQLCETIRSQEIEILVGYIPSLIRYNTSQTIMFSVCLLECIRGKKTVEKCNASCFILYFFSIRLEIVFFFRSLNFLFFAHCHRLQVVMYFFLFLRVGQTNENECTFCSQV